MVLADYDGSKIEEVKKECVSSSNVSREDIERTRYGIFKGIEKLSDYYYCIFKKMNWMDQHSSVYCYKLHELVKAEEHDRNEIIRMLDNCCTVPETSEGKAFEVYRCYIENKPNDFELLHIHDPQEDF